MTHRQTLSSSLAACLLIACAATYGQSNDRKRDAELIQRVAERIGDRIGTQFNLHAADAKRGQAMKVERDRYKRITAAWNGYYVGGADGNIEAKPIIYYKKKGSQFVPSGKTQRRIKFRQYVSVRILRGTGSTLRNRKPTNKLKLGKRELYHSEFVTKNGRQQLERTKVVYFREEGWSKAAFGGAPGEIYTYHVTGQFRRPTGYHSTSFNDYTIADKFNVDWSEIDAYCVVPAGEGKTPVVIEVDSRERNWRSSTPSFELPHIKDKAVTGILNYIVSAVNAELGGATQRPVPTPTPTPVVRLPEPKKPKPVPTPTPAVTRPQRPDASAIKRLAAMDQAMKDVEEKVQAILVTIQTVTRQIGEKGRERDELLAAYRREKDPATKEAMRKELASIINELKAYQKYRDRLTNDVMLVMNEAVAKVQRIHDEYGFGDQAYNAAVRLDAVHTRKKFLQAQIHLSRGETKRTIAFARELRKMPLMSQHSYYIEGMALLQSGELVAALDLFRHAQKLYRNKPGVPFETLERQAEIQILRALQGMASNGRSKFENQFENWIAAKAETEKSPNKSRFGWMVERALWRGWYDTMSGLVGRFTETVWKDSEARARAEEVVIVADDMAQTHIGLEILIGLRKYHSLKEIVTMDGEAFRKAVEKHWGYKLKDEDVERMRRRMMHAAQLPDMKKLVSDETLGAGDVLSKELVQQVGFNGMWERSIDLAATGGNIVNGWTMLTTFAPAAKLGGLGKSGLMSAKTAELEFEGVTTLGEFFVASTPLQGAVNKMATNPVGRKALQALEKVHDFGQRGLAHTGVVVLGQVAVDAGVSYLVKEHLGEDAALAYEAFSALGGTSADTYGSVFKKVKVDALRARQAALQIRQNTQRARIGMQRSEELMQRWQLMLDAPPQPRMIESMRRELLAARTVPNNITGRLEASLLQFRAGNRAGALQTLEDVKRLRQHSKQLIAKAEQVADGLENAARHLPESQASLLQGALKRDKGGLIREGAGTKVTDGPTTTGGGTKVTEGPTTSGGGTKTGEKPGLLNRDGAGTKKGTPIAGGTKKGEKPGLLNRDGGGTKKGGPTAGRNVEDRFPGQVAETRRTMRDVADVKVDWDAEPIESTRFLTGKPDAPTYDADRLVADGQFDEAISEYHRVAIKNRDNPELLEAIDIKIARAREAREGVKLKTGLGDAIDTPKPPPVHDSPELMDEVKQAIVADEFTINRKDGLPDEFKDQALERAHLESLGQPDTPHQVDIASVKGGEGSASSPKYVIGKDGKPIAVSKNPIGPMGNHPEGQVEEFASRLSELLDDMPGAAKRGTPKARVQEFDMPDGTKQKKLITEMLPPGDELTPLILNDQLTMGDLLAYKDELSDDLVFSMFLGDGDRHLRNYRLTTSGELVPYDYGLADLFPNHPYRKPGEYLTMPETIQKQRDELTKLVKEGASAQKIQKAEQALEKLEGYQQMTQLYWDRRFPTPPDPSHPQFREYVKGTMRKHMRWAGRQMAAGDGALTSAMNLERMKKTVAKLKKLRDTNQLDKLIDTAFAGNPDKEFTRKLLNTRIEVIEEILEEYFPAAVKGATGAMFTPLWRWRVAA